MPMPGLALLIAKKKSPVDDGDMPMDEGHDKKEVCRQITKALINAIHDKDDDATFQCIKDLVGLLDEDDEGEAGDDEGSY